MPADSYYLIIPASGVGSRMKATIAKQYLPLENGLTVLDQTLSTLLNITQIKRGVIAHSKQDTQFKSSKFYHHSKISFVIGGEFRHQSVMNALKTLEPIIKDNDWVLVHDSVRPCVKIQDVENLIKQLKDNPVGGLLATKVVDSIKQSSSQRVKSSVDRKNLWQAQTPQMYRFGVLFKALKTAIDDNTEITDEAGAIEHLGLKSLLVEASKSNLKITHPEDLALANFYLNQGAM
jgi:2-C-methyl-D-erythritol 4-phosphate cytidylyltransferase